MRLLSFFLLFLSFTNIATAAVNHSGKWFLLWGYNRAFYEKSDIHFKGNGYDFTLHDVVANDRQSKFQWEWLTPWGLTIPQTNARVGYYLDNNHRAYFGVDHMKYVMKQGQTVAKTGTDHTGDSGSTQLITPSYLQYEHTDGLNYVNAGYEMLTPLWQNDTFKLSQMHGPDIGIVFPRTNVTMAGKARHDEFNVAGYGASYKLGFVLDIGKDWLLQCEYKKGRLIMPWIRTSYDTADSASQNINFTQMNFAAAYVF